LPVFEAQSTLLQCSAVIGVTALLALLGRFLPKLPAALLRPFFLSRERIHGLMIGQANFTASTYIKSLSAVSRRAPSLGWCIVLRGKAVHVLLMRTQSRTMRSIPGLQLCFAHILIAKSIG
jgi:hypothetical protein